jgi:antitoxin MazE
LYTTIQKWGNSQAVRIPKIILEKAGLRENDRVEIRVEKGNLLIIPQKKHLTLQERAAEYNGDYQPVEWDTGKPKGKEIW